MSKVNRKVIYEGEYFTFECAIRFDGSSPAEEMLVSLESGMLVIPGYPAPDDLQTKFYTDFLSFVRDIGDGYLPRNGAVNYLREGIWELKRESVRITFYDTNGEGRFHGHQNADLLHDSFYRTFRLGHCFLKESQKTSAHDMKLALIIRDEDLEHDKD